MMTKNRISNRRHRSKSRRILDDDCNIKQKTCENNTAKYNKADIVNLAQKCGVDVLNEKGKAKSRKELCKNIVDLQTQDFEIVVEEEPISNIPEVPILNIPETPVINEDIYTQDKLKSKYIPELLTIASGLGITKWNNKSIKNQKKQNIIDAILDKVKISVEPTISQPIFEPLVVPEADFVVIEEPTPSINILSKDELKKKTKVELLKMAKDYEIESWLNKKISRHNKPEIIDAIFDYLNKQVTIPSKIEDNITKPIDMLNLISQKRRDLISKLKVKKDNVCDPLENLNCKGNDVCDVSKIPNTCISNEEAQYKKGKGESEIMLFKGKNIVGTKKSLEVFKDIVDSLNEEEDNLPGGFGEHKEEIPTLDILKSKEILCQLCNFSNSPETSVCILCNSDLSNKEFKTLLLPEGTEIFETEKSLPEGTEITEIANIEDILNEIQNKDDTDINNIKGLDEAKKKVLYCLGLLN